MYIIIIKAPVAHAIFAPFKNVAYFHTEVEAQRVVERLKLAGATICRVPSLQEAA